MPLVITGKKTQKAQSKIKPTVHCKNCSYDALCATVASNTE